MTTFAIDTNKLNYEFTDIDDLLDLSNIGYFALISGQLALNDEILDILEPNSNLSKEDRIINAKKMINELIIQSQKKKRKKRRARV